MSSIPHPSRGGPTRSTRPPSSCSLGINGNNVSAPLAVADLPPRVRKFMHQAAARELLPSEGVASCLRAVIPLSTVKVLYSSTQKASMFAGLVTCKSVWMCPVCAAKITEKRRVELAAGLAFWAVQGRYGVLVTFTLQHSGEEPLAVVLAALKASYRKLIKDRWWRSFVAQYGLVGSIRALEVTHGESGWHPHLHVLFFFDREPGLVPLETDLKSRWSALLSASGRYASWDYGVDVKMSNEEIAGYVAKFGRWSASHEMTKSPSKLGRRAGRSPLQLLADFALGDLAAGELWKEYALAFKRSRQLTWSRGLRQLLGLVEQEKTDGELVDEVEEDAVVLAQLTLNQWRVVVANDCRAELLAVAASGDASLLHAYLLRLGIDVYVPPCPGSGQVLDPV